MSRAKTNPSGHLKGGRQEDRWRRRKGSEVQTAADLTLRGQRSWETAGQRKDERSMPWLNKPRAACVHIGEVDRVRERGLGGEKIKIKSYKVKQWIKWMGSSSIQQKKSTEYKWQCWKVTKDLYEIPLCDLLTFRSNHLRNICCVPNACSSDCNMVGLLPCIRRKTDKLAFAMPEPFEPVAADHSGRLLLAQYWLISHLTLSLWGPLTLAFVGQSLSWREHHHWTKPC